MSVASLPGPETESWPDEAAPSVAPPAGRPLPKSPLVSQQMRRMPRSSTQPELRLRRSLHAAGLRFTVNRRDLPGTPDVALSKARLAIFLDGCFWHGCPSHFVLPKSNSEWWRNKLEATRARDLRKDQALRDMGWEPIHLWEHERLDDATAAIFGLWTIRTGRKR